MAKKLGYFTVIKNIETSNGSVMYLNSGDWIENLTALEYNQNQLTLYNYETDNRIEKNLKDDLEDEDTRIPENKELFQNLMHEIHFEFKPFKK
ncbi:hypothetical protein [Flavivirga aquatica]|uniref:hypothetical protein n=1 Tax=Flavivirga aquatica TaxID=1849968 RepID=UPI0026BA84DC